ncbi:RNA polymerase sigma-70 factor, ECF subfamily [Rubritalea squalenifaciens DSM 18772]|uniref:RNA polymerase sigma-70 factor, ECF subfamily n=2 Tax=Rubritalea squalenifaciens TaxID=407226 RepID=A0A1M6GX44_9BACT|nr:RNA polymerase sigma-70 factor, ECF subfamily [Rubritalea squalenifaciens DSM 18772]
MHNLTMSDIHHMSLPTETTDEELVRMVLAGCTNSYRSIIARYENKLMAFLLKRLNERSDAQDVCQETFIAIYRNLESFDTEKSFSAWIYGIARNKANDHFRKLKPLPEPANASDILSTTPRTDLDSNEQAEVFWDEARRLLSDDQFTALWLHYQQEMPVKMISETMKQSPSNVKIHLFRGRKALAQSSLLAEQHELAATVNH